MPAVRIAYGSDQTGPTNIHPHLEPMNPVKDLGRIVSVEQSHVQSEHEPAGLDGGWGDGRRSTG
jgi:hypothetical protein